VTRPFARTPAVSGGIRGGVPRVGFALGGIRRVQPRGLLRLGAVITILSIAGTLCGCGRYGSPVRVVPTETTNSEAIATAADEPSDPKDAETATDENERAE